MTLTESFVKRVQVCLYPPVLCVVHADISACPFVALLTLLKDSDSSVRCKAAEAMSLLTNY